MEAAMDDSLASEQPADRHAEDAVQASAPAMPVIRQSEKLPYGNHPYPLLDGLPRTIGWVWRSGTGGDSAFVIIGRGRMGGYKILERFPLTVEGWAAAWQALAQADAAAADKVKAVLATRITQDAARAQRDTQPFLIVTTNEIPGYRITQVHGDVFGLTVRVRGYFSNLGASFRTLAGGEVAGYTKLLADSRNQARERMWLEARAKGANAVVAMRFDCNEIGDIMSEIAAYGTAVTVEPVQPAPTVTTLEAG
jgi:uncharacterized protein YbjQ (UPF0145 family)